MSIAELKVKTNRVRTYGIPHAYSANLDWLRRVCIGIIDPGCACLREGHGLILVHVGVPGPTYRFRHRAVSVLVLVLVGKLVILERLVK